MATGLKIWVSIKTLSLITILQPGSDHSGLIINTISSGRTALIIPTDAVPLSLILYILPYFIIFIALAWNSLFYIFTYVCLPH